MWPTLQRCVILNFYKNNSFECFVFQRAVWEIDLVKNLLEQVVIKVESMETNLK